MSRSTNGTGKDPRSLRDRITAAPQLAREAMSVPEWEGVDIEVRGLTLGWRSRIMRDGYSSKDDKPSPVFEVFYPLILAGSCFDPSDGTPIFAGDLESDAFRACNLTPEQQEKIQQLINTLNPLVVDRIAKVAMRLSGLSSEGSEKNAGVESQSGSPVLLSPLNSA